MNKDTLSLYERAAAEESEWIMQSKKDPAAFRPLYLRYFRSVYLFMLRRVGDKELSADLTQQVFLKALLHIPRYELRGIPFSVWLFKIALNHLNEYYRKSKQARTVVLDEAGLETLFEEITADQRLENLEQQLPAILQKLSLPDLQLIELRYFENRSFYEIGQLLGITENYAKVRTYRALDRMKKLFQHSK
jgi:RNA polymerase sigma-70 factor (ECF subfamily)